MITLKDFLSLVLEGGIRVVEPTNSDVDNVIYDDSISGYDEEEYAKMLKNYGDRMVKYFQPFAECYGISHAESYIEIVVDTE